MHSPRQVYCRRPAVNSINSAGRTSGYKGKEESLTVLTELGLYVFAHKCIEL